MRGLLTSSYVAFTCVCIASGAGGDPAEVDVCHIAPGQGPIMIRVSESALEAHLQHGDFTPSQYYADTDGDGFGDPLAPLHACGEPAGYIADDTDCDDSDPNVHPFAAEVCNGVDDDCDGTTEVEIPSGLRHWWAAEESTTDSVTGLDGDPLVLDFAAGVGEGSAFSLSGVGSGIEVNGAYIDELQTLSVAAWVRLDALGRFQYVLIKDGQTFNGTFHTYQLYVMPDGTVGFALGDGVNLYWGLESAFPLQANEWYFLTGTYDGNVQSLYVDGALSAQAEIGDVTPLFQHLNPLRIGIIFENGQYYYSLGGLIDEVQLYDRALSAEEVSVLHAAAGNMCLVQ